jgi:hypothetical protein
MLTAQPKSLASAGLIGNSTVILLCITLKKKAGLCLS